MPLYKVGDKNFVNNYRPISILPVFAKVFEQLLYPILSWHFKLIIDPNQHGFMRARSTTTNLVSFVDNISKELDTCFSVDAIYTDFSKAFDRVNHQLLLDKLSAYGVAEPLLSWFGSYLSKRKSLVVASGHSSDPFPVHSGVPQGSHLGPLLFNVFINDIGECFHNSKYCLFADDLKIFKAVKSSTDSILLQHDLDRLILWCQRNNMDLNVAKCFFIHFSRKNSNPHTQYKLHNDVLEEVTYIRDLGVTLDYKLRLNMHIDNICNKAFKSLGFVLRNCKDFRCPKTKIVLYNSLVRSHLEYCSVVWNPFYEVYKKRIESVQKRFLWHLTYSCNLAKTIRSYPERLFYFEMSSLSDRRRILDVLFLYKLANSLLDAPYLLSTLNFSVPSRYPRAARVIDIIKETQINSNLGKNAPLNRIIRYFNTTSKHNMHVDLFTESIFEFRKAIMKNVG